MSLLYRSIFTAVQPHLTTQANITDEKGAETAVQTVKRVCQVVELYINTHTDPMIFHSRYKLLTALVVLGKTANLFLTYVKLDSQG